MCSIINFKRYGSIQELNQAFGDQWVYIGRANSHAGLEQSPLANPFRVKDYGGRGKTLPYYLHLLDPVAGAMHFDISRKDALKLKAEMEQQLPGYLVPKLVQEIAGKPAKTAIFRI